MNRTLLIDGDIVAYRSTAAVETDTKFGRYHILWSDEDNAYQVAEDFIEELMEQAGVSECILAFSHELNFRKEIAPDAYKVSRKGTRKPLA